VHDAYGTHAADMDALQAGLRDVFVEMYEGADVLDQFAKQLLAVTEMEGKELPPMPTKGTLDLAGIRQSDFFFA
jgi:DNA-directed RNA polymerase